MPRPSSWVWTEVRRRPKPWRGRSTTCQKTLGSSPCTRSSRGPATRLAPIDASFDPQVIGSAKAELEEWIADVRSGCARSDRGVGADVEIGAARWTLTNPDLGADLLVVGHRGRSGITARVLGSVADHVVRHAPVPVIVVRGTSSS